MKYWLKVVISFVIINLVLYLAGSFITLDLNPMNWFIFKDGYGRFFFLYIETVILVISRGFYRRLF